MNIDLNQIEAMTTTELEAHYGRLETEAFRLRVAISAVSLELEARIKSRRQTPLGVEEQTASGDSRLTINPNPHPSFIERDEAMFPRYAKGVEINALSRIKSIRMVRKDKGTKREGVRALDHASCCGAEGRRMNSETLDCAACREVVE